MVIVLSKESQPNLKHASIETNRIKCKIINKNIKIQLYKST